MANTIEMNGVLAANPEGYIRKKEALIKRQKLEDDWWAKPVVIITLTLAFSALDALVLYSVLDMAMLQSKLMGIVMAAGIALVLNIIPLLVAKFVHQAIYKTKRFALTWAILSIIGFFLMFAATVNLRFAYHDLYGGSAASTLVNTVATGDEDSEIALDEDGNPVETEDEDTAKTEIYSSKRQNNVVERKSYAVVDLLCVEPLLTSLANFFLAFLSSDEIRKRKENLEVAKHELGEAIADLEAAEASLDRDVERELALDYEEYVCAVHEVEAIREILKAQARFYLAEYLADPSSITKLSHELDREPADECGNVPATEGGSLPASEGDCVEPVEAA